MKSTFRTVLYSFALILLACTLTGCNYNALVSLREDVDKQWANVENQYQRRADLVPNLVATVQGYASHEAEVFAQIAQARANLGTSITIDSSITEDASKMEEFQRLQAELGSGLSRLLAISEAYPELKADSLFLDLQSQLEGTENRIATERKRYNDSVSAYNKAVQSFPTMLYASRMGFSTKVYFKAEQTSYKAPSVSF